MTDALTVFAYQDAQVRSFLDDNGDPWFVAADVCTVLDIGTEQTRRLDDDEKDLRTMQTPSGKQQMVIVNQSGLFNLIFASRKPEAKTFKKWITSEVLPALFKTGSYALKPQSPLEILKQQVALMEAQERLLANHENRIERIEAKVDAAVNGEEYYTIIAYAKIKHLKPPDTVTAQRLGRRATSLSEIRGLTTGKANHSYFGEVKTYHISILDSVFGSVS
jgi:prophage antirepressor-like protein